jgi:hypothetical protein
MTRARLLLIGAASCGTAPVAHAAPALGITNSIVLTRADGSVVPVTQQIRVWCGRWARDVPTPALRVFVGNPRGGRAGR